LLVRGQRAPSLWWFGLDTPRRDTPAPPESGTQPAR